MARFPTREADVAALAGNVIVGLTESAEDFPAPPIPAADLKAALDGYLASRDKASVADGAAAEAHGEKAEALEALHPDPEAMADPLKPVNEHRGQGGRHSGVTGVLVWKLYEVACPARLGGAYVGKHINWTGPGRSMQPNRWRCAADLRPAWQSRAMPATGRPGFNADKTATRCQRSILRIVGVSL